MLKVFSFVNVYIYVYSYTKHFKCCNLDKSILLCVKISSSSAFNKLCLDSQETYKVNVWHYK